MSAANPIARLSPASDPVSAARARVLAGILFLVAGVVRAAYAPFLDSDLIVVLMLGGLLESAALSAGFLFLLRGGVPGASTGARILALVLVGAYAIQAILSLLLAVDGVFFLSLGLGLVALLAGIAYSIVAALNSALHQVLRRLPLGLFVGLLLTSLMLAGEPVLVYIFAGVLFAGFGLAVLLISRPELAGAPLFASPGTPRAAGAPNHGAPRAATPTAAAEASVPPVPGPIPPAATPESSRRAAAPTPSDPAATPPFRPATTPAASRPAQAPPASAPARPAAASLPVAGWYSDPAGGGQLRLWDGERWTDQVRPWPTYSNGA